MLPLSPRFASRPSTIASVLLAVAITGTAGATVAYAGPYLGLGVGTSPDLRGEMQGFSAASRSGRLTLGQRFSILSVEGAVGGYQLANPADVKYDSISVSGGGRLSLTLEGPLAVFARAGVERTWLRADVMPDYQGNGVYGGIGAELSLALPLGETSIWVDYSRHRATLHSGDAELDTEHGLWTAGLSVGL